MYDKKKALFVKCNSAYLLPKKRRLSNHPYLLELQKENRGQNIGKAYLNDQKWAEFTEYISQCIKSKLADVLT